MLARKVIMGARCFKLTFISPSEAWRRFERANADADSFNVLEGNMKCSFHRESNDVSRSPQAVACKK